MIRTRRPSADDKTILRLIKQELIPLNPPQLRPKWSPRDLLRRLGQGKTFVWVPEGRPYERIAGFITAVVRGEELFVDLLALDRAFQGYGGGGKLLQRAERFGVQRGCKVMRLYVNDTNQRGIRFYYKHGMTAVGYDMQYRSIIMEKRIG